MENDQKKTTKKTHEQRIVELVKINAELASEVQRLNKVVAILTGPIGNRPESDVLLWRQRRTRELEEIYRTVMEVKDGEVN